MHAYQRFREAGRKKAKHGNGGRAVNAVMFMDEIERAPASDLYSAMREVVANKSIAAWVVSSASSVIAIPDFGILFVLTCCSIGRRVDQMITF